METPQPRTSPLAANERASNEGATNDGTTNGVATEGLPRAFGRYVLFDLVGRGGMAEIFLAKARTTEAGGSRLVVVKQILPELSASAKFSEAFVAEAKLAARLSHANVVQVLDLGRAPSTSMPPPASAALDAPSSRAEGAKIPMSMRPTPVAPHSRLFIAMEYVEGLDLNELLRRCARAKVPLPIEFALLVVMETLRGLDYAHRRTDDDGKPLGIVHRDVSPSNVLVSVEGEVKLCDFGIARAMMVPKTISANAANAATEAADNADAIQGKAGYMSPEHARGEPLDARADVFAAGVILWELLAGRRLYKADKVKNESLLAVARRAEITELPARGVPYEDELRAVVAKALAVDRHARFATAGAMLEALQAYVTKARLVASPIRLGEWLTQHFGNELVDQRRARERAVKALELGPAATVTPATPKAEPKDAPKTTALPTPKAGAVAIANADPLKKPASPWFVAVVLVVCAVIVALVYTMARH